MPYLELSKSVVFGLSIELVGGLVIAHHGASNRSRKRNLKVGFRSSWKISGKLEGGPFLCLIDSGDDELLLSSQCIRGQRTTKIKGWIQD